MRPGSESASWRELRRMRWQSMPRYLYCTAEPVDTGQQAKLMPGPVCAYVQQLSNIIQRAGTVPRKGSSQM